MADNKWIKKIKKLAIVQKTIATSKKLKLPGFEGLSVYQVLYFFIQGLQKGYVMARASAISYQIILALAPTLILLLTLIPYVPVDNFQENLLNGIEGMLPGSTFTFVEETLNDLIKAKHNTFLSISFLLGIYYASNSVNALLQGFRGSYNLINKTNYFKQRLFSVVLVIILPLFIGSGFLVQAFTSTLVDYLVEKKLLFDGIQTILIYGAKWITVLLLFLAGITTLYNLGNPDRDKWRFFSAGASFSALMIIVLSQLFSWYVNNFGQFNKFYGSLATVVILLLWIQFINVILLLGFELNTSISRAQIKHKEGLAELEETAFDS